MKPEELLHIIHPLQQAGRFDGTPGRLVIDSREVRKNDVFLALRGTRSDGHAYIREAVRKGAGVIIAEHIPDAHSSGTRSSKTIHPEENVWYLQVADTRSIAGELAQAFADYPAKSMKMVGITGTNGKTTVSTLVYQVLVKLGYHAGLLGTVETRIGDKVLPSRLTTPDSVTIADILRQMVEVDTAFAIMEVSSHALEQQRTGGIRFDVAGFTNISQDHLDYHRDMASYIEAKKRLFVTLDENAVSVVNRDDPASWKVTDGCRADTWSFGFESDRDFRILDERSDGMVLDLDGTIVSTPLTGRYNAYNVAQAYLICLALGCPQYSVAGALGDATGAPGRLERVTAGGLREAETPKEANGQKPAEAGGDSAGEAEMEPGASVETTPQPVVFVDYAHTPDALENVLRTLDNVRSRKETLHVVFGCGGDRDRTKRAEMGRIADRYADVVTLTSDNPRTEEPDAIIRDIRGGIVRSEHLYIEPRRRKAIRSAILDADTRTIVLIAGKGHETYQEVHGRRHKFDDREIAAKALAEWIDRRLSGKRKRARKTGGEVS
ncbi:UDP-N-acetylmuramoyl-L-alanyl-D-glutamate--2,6-diaminopimelate ligase [Balneolales bacterium ANBcel1]|nr:UDP-N-acetylmuramoyl-L-alanyl-D-glutamate--2,6-diaminopimelate ligase [Balneolales bacterium ANBcel1]